MNTVSANIAPTDEAWMQLALEEAYKGFGTTSPNPPVGAVIVKDGILLGKGHHIKAGQPHAEREALAEVRRLGREKELKGATIYVTLEPCSSYGRTPPCTEGIIEAGIARVVYGAVDPDERHRGRADALLKENGIQTHSGVCKAACELLLRSWAYSVREKRPWVTAKVATTLDGRLKRRVTRWLSNEQSICYAHELRLRSDAILVGGNTVRTDNPALTIRTPLTNEIPPAKEQPWRIVLTRNKSMLPADAALFTDAHADRTLVFENVGDLKILLETLYRDYGIVNLMLECGGRLLRRFLEAGLVNMWVQEITPVLSGGAEEVLPGDYLPQERRICIESITPVAGNIILKGIIRGA